MRVTIAALAGLAAVASAQWTSEEGAYSTTYTTTTKKTTTTTTTYPLVTDSCS